MDLISVVVPVYNVINYLDKCIKSIIHQDYLALEIILVDDGSTDGSGELCDDYSKLDKRIIVCHKENGGLSDARNVGIRHASGKFITFVDSDDYIDEEYVSYLYQLLHDNSADMSVCEFNYINQKGHTINKPINNGSIEKMDQKRALKYLLKQKPFSNSASGKLFKTSYFKDISFPVGKLYEDTATIYKIFLKSNIIVFGARALYMYLYRENSLSKQQFNIKQLDSAINAETMTNDILNIYPELENACVCRRFDPYIGILRAIPENEYNQETKAYFNKIKRDRWVVLFSSESTNKRRFYAFFSIFGYRVLKNILKYK